MKKKPWVDEEALPWGTRVWRNGQLARVIVTPPCYLCQKGVHTAHVHTFSVLFDDHREEVVSLSDVKVVSPEREAEIRGIQLRLASTG